MRRALLAVALFALASLAGCFGKDLAPPAPVDETGGVALSEQTIERIDAVAAAKPSRFAFPPADAPAVTRAVAWFNGSIGPESATGFESAQDRGGTSFNAIVQSQDFSSFVPAGQPTLINLRMWFDNGPARSVDIDIFVDAYGTRTHEAREYADEMTWTLPVKTKSVTTAGLAPTVLGVQAANGRMAPGMSVSYWMRIEFLYANDVAAPKVPYALEVPANASGLIVESLKFAGDTHVQGRFLLVSPDDDLVVAVAFDDIAIPTQSIYVPVPGPGRYVFYVIDVKNGFFSVRADAPLDDPLAKPLERKVTETVLITDPVAPGMSELRVDDVATPWSEGTSKDFAVEGAFPLEVWPFMTGDGATGDVHLKVVSPKGVASEYHRFARYDGAQGSIGVSDEDLEENNRLWPENLARGAHKLSAVVNGMMGQAGVRLVTYVR